MGTLTAVGLIVLGWLLGILSQAIGAAIHKQRQRRETATGIWVELNELRMRLICSVLSVAKYSGAQDRPLLEWAQASLDSCEGGEQLDAVRSFTATLLRIDAQELAALAGMNRRRPGVVPRVARRALPFLDARFPEIAAYSTRVQRGLMEIRSELAIINEQAEQVDRLLDMTFDSSIDQGRLTTNLETLYVAIRDRSRSLVDRIGQLPPDLGAATFGQTVRRRAASLWQSLRSKRSPEQTG